MPQLDPMTKSWLTRWQSLIPEFAEAPPWESEDCAAGVLNDLRHDLVKLDAAFELFAQGRELLMRFRNLVAWAGEPLDAGRYPYLYVHNPPPTSDDALIGMAQVFLERMQRLSQSPPVSTIEVVRSDSPSEAISDATLRENSFDPLAWAVTDLFDGPLEQRIPGEHLKCYHFLNDPLYGLACDFSVREYVRWALVEPFVECDDPTQPLIDLWRSGATGFLLQERHIRLYAPLLDERSPDSRRSM